MLSKFLCGSVVLCIVIYLSLPLRGCSVSTHNFFQKHFLKPPKVSATPMPGLLLLHLIITIMIYFKPDSCVSNLDLSIRQERGWKSRQENSSSFRLFPEFSAEYASLCRRAQCPCVFVFFDDLPRPDFFLGCLSQTRQNSRHHVNERKCREDGERDGDDADILFAISCRYQPDFTCEAILRQRQ